MSESGFTVFVAFACGSAKAEQSKPELQSERLLTKQSRFANNATLPSVPRKILPLNLSPALALMRSAADAEI